MTNSINKKFYLSHIDNIYKELQLINEFHSDFHPTVESELRKTKLIKILENIMYENTIHSKRINKRN